MSDYINPYQSPQAEITPVSSSLGGLTENARRYLQEASPWLRFIGVLGFIGCGFTALMGVIFLTVFPALTRLSGNFDFEARYEFFRGGIMNHSRIMEGAIGFLYIIIALISFFPARFVYNFGAKLRAYMMSNSEKDLEAALKNNKSLWKFAGILSIVYLAFIPVSIIPVSIIGFIIAAIGSVLF
jgi:hypothetical protein